MCCTQEKLSATMEGWSTVGCLRWRLTSSVRCRFMYSLCPPACMCFKAAASSALPRTWSWSITQSHIEACLFLPCRSSSWQWGVHVDVWFPLVYQFTTFNSTCVHTPLCYCVTWHLVHHWCVSDGVCGPIQKNRTVSNDSLSQTNLNIPSMYHCTHSCKTRA